MALHFPDVIDLNVGGRHLTTSLSTLTKYRDSMLAAMFSGRQPVIQDKDGRYFIDVDGDVFVHVLNFLRFETMPPPEAAADVRKYADYFGLAALKTGIPSTQGNGEALYDIWRSNCLSKVTDYTRYWEQVERELKTLDFSSRSICLTTTLDWCNCQVGVCSLPSLGYSEIKLNLSDCNLYRRPSVLNLLAHDVQRLGVFTFEGNIHSICNSQIGILLRIK